MRNRPVKYLILFSPQIPSCSGPTERAFFCQVQWGSISIPLLCAPRDNATWLVPEPLAMRKPGGCLRASPASSSSSSSSSQSFPLNYGAKLIHLAFFWGWSYIPLLIMSSFKGFKWVFTRGGSSWGFRSTPTALQSPRQQRHGSRERHWQNGRGRGVGGLRILGCLTTKKFWSCWWIIWEKGSFMV